LEKDAGMFLNDNQWHTVHIERNRKQAWLKVDNQGATVLEEPMELQFRTFYFTQNLSIGSSVKFDQGFVGCLKAFQVNGLLYDLAGKIRSGEYTYGVSVGCHQKCAPVNPCLNNGECEERYDSYYCECGRTAFRGHICGRGKFAQRFWLTELKLKCFGIPFRCWSELST
jgi:contactin associated protein-like 2